MKVEWIQQQLQRQPPRVSPGRGDTAMTTNYDRIDSFVRPGSLCCGLNRLVFMCGDGGRCFALCFRITFLFLCMNLRTWATCCHCRRCVVQVYRWHHILFS